MLGFNHVVHDNLPPFVFGCLDDCDVNPVIEMDLWTKPFLARYAVEPVLPTSSGDVGFTEVEVEDDGVSPVYDHALRQYVQTDNQTMSIIQGIGLQFSNWQTYCPGCNHRILSLAWVVKTEVLITLSLMS